MSFFFRTFAADFVIINCMQKNLLSFSVWILLTCMCSASAYAANASYDVWNGTNATDMTAAHVMEIHSAADLAGIAALSAAEDFTGDTIVLKTNIDLDKKAWAPIGSADKPFKGVFLGNGYLIRGLRTFAGTDGVGLFGHVGQGAKIEQVGISGGAILAKNKTHVGAIAGVCDGTISQCWSMAQFVTTGNSTGGLVGELTANGRIQDCYQSGYLNNTSSIVGGIVGTNAGTLERVYNIGYASGEDGHAIVGEDNDGTYNECYFDRKLYLQKSGVEGNAITPVDSTRYMFSLFNGNAVWSHAATRYPVLEAFATTDAAALSAAPVFLDSIGTNPVEHANDVTLDFSVSIENGIAWNCQKQEDTTWLNFNNAEGAVQVVRPCAPNPILVDARLNDETRVLYFNPRRVEDLVPGEFIGRDLETGALDVTLYFCYNSYEPVKDDVQMKLAQYGWMGDDDHHYQVLRYQVTETDTVVIDTMLADAPKSDYLHWFDTCLIPTDTAGHFFIRSFVHDNGCATDWRENKTGLEYYVYGRFIPGTIENKKDTILLDQVPVLVSTSGSEASVGGAGQVYYQWFVNGDSILSQTQLELIGYPITKAGEYNFTRGTRDSICYVPEYGLEDLGVYTVLAFDSIDPGEITNRADQTFCTVDDAKAYMVTATKAKGGAGTIQYRWFMDGQLISGATSQNLSLNGLNLAAGHTYIFTREAQDDTRFTTWKKTRYSKTIYIMASLTAGAIESETRDNYCFDADATSGTTATIVIHETRAATCADGVVYRWVRTPDNVVIGDEAELNYTFPMSEIRLGTTYTYTRYVRNSNPDCAWELSEGEVKQYYGQSQRYEVTMTICKERMPYTLQHTYASGQTESHTFTYDGEAWTVTETTEDCPVDSVFIVRIAEMPKFTMDTSPVHVCQETGTMALEFVQTAGMSNTFRITFSPDMAAFMGRQDTVGTITRPGLILLENMPPIGVGDCYLELELGYTGGGATDEICYSEPAKKQVTFSLGGYLHTKYDRVLFVDNNPDNGLITGGAEKLKFVAYQWYKDGQILEGETKQYYHQNGAALSGIFYVMLTAENGDEYRSCEVTLPTGSGNAAPQLTNVYPVPVDAGNTLTIEGAQQAQIISFAGEKIADLTQLQQTATIAAPRVPGLYFVMVMTEEGMPEIHKLIVK